MSDDMDWWTAGQKYACDVGAAEYRVQFAEHLKKGRSRKTFRPNPSQYLRDLCAALGKNDEEGFKAIKMYRGPSEETK